MSALAAVKEQHPKMQETDLGPIPADWIIRRVDDVCILINGRGFKPYEWRDRGLPIIRIQNLNGSSDFNYFDGAYNRKIEVDPGQLLFAWSGSRGTSFGPHIWPGPLGVLNYHTWKVAVDTKSVSPAFFFHALKGLTKFIEDQAHGASALVHVQKWQMEKFQLALPPTIAEQEAIAEALSDADALIESLESLIAKKRAVKQGAMQELLSGRQRLAGFSKPWREVKFSQILSHHSGNSGLIKGRLANECIDGWYPAYSASGNDVWHSEYEHSGDALIVSAVGSRCGKVFKASGNWCAIANTHVLWPDRQNVDLNFLHFILDDEDFWVKGGSGQPFVKFRESFSKVLMLPSLDEQREVSQMLSEMSEELEALSTRLTKARQIKQGMMQDLLTGKVRLV